MVNANSLFAKFEKLFKFVFILISILCCSSQFISIVNLYLTYPTNIHIDTQFDMRHNNLASFTFCKRTWDSNVSRNSTERLEYSNTINVVNDISILGGKFSKEIDLDDLHNQYITRVDSVSLKYYCLNLQGKLSSSSWKRKVVGKWKMSDLGFQQNSSYKPMALYEFLKC